MEAMTEAHSAGQNDEPAATSGSRSGTVVVVGPDGRPVGTVQTDDGPAGEDPTRLIEQPAKVMRIGSMIKQLLEEVKAAPLDDASRHRHARDPRAVDRRAEGGPRPRAARRAGADLAALRRGAATPSEGELRIAHAQLVGWLEGLFHGIQAALVAQQMAARMQLEQMRSGGRQALPSGPGGLVPGMPRHAGRPGSGGDDGHSTGQYL